MKLKPNKRLILVFSYLLVGFLVVIAVKAFTGPTQNPPGGNPAWPKVNSVVGTTDIFTNSTSYVDMADMTYTDTFTAGNVMVMFSGSINSFANDQGYLRMLVDAVPVDTQTIHENATEIPFIMVWVGSVSAGSHIIHIEWKTTVNDVSNSGSIYPRRLTIIRGLN